MKWQPEAGGLSRRTARHVQMPNGNRTLPYWIPLACILALSAFACFHNLGSSHISTWDEVVHANIVQNLAADCCVPRLHRLPNLPIDISDWRTNGVWLHKPLLPFLISAGPYAFFGHSLWAMRLPGAIFALVTTLLVFLIGRKFFDQNIALVAAAIFGLNPYTIDQVHGREFAGFPDLAFVLCLTVALFFLLDWSETHSGISVRWFGAALGFAYLCKAGLALAPFAVLAILILISRQRRDWTAALQAFAIFLVIAAPLNLFWRVYYPAEFQSARHEQLSHLFTSVGTWGRPWYTHLLTHLPNLLTLPLVPFAYVSVAWALARFRSHRAASILALWTLAYVVPLSFAVTKVENYMFPVFPALALLAPQMIKVLFEKRQFLLLLALSVASVAPTAVHTLNDLAHRRLAMAIAVIAALPVTLVIIWCFKKTPGRTAVAALLCAATALVVTYVRADLKENRVGDYPGEAALRATGIELGHLVDSQALVLAHADSPELDMAEIDIMYWSGVDVFDPCHVPDPAAALRSLQNRPDMYLITQSPLPEPPIATLPSGSLYPVSNVPAGRWQPKLLSECH